MSKVARWLGNNLTGYCGNRTGWLFLIFLQYIQSPNLSDIGAVRYENLFTNIYLLQICLLWFDDSLRNVNNVGGKLAVRLFFTPRRWKRQENIGDCALNFRM